MTGHLTRKVVEADLRAVVAEKGADYVYPGSKRGIEYGSCVYFDETNLAPSCIVGHVLARHGLTIDDVDNEASFDSMYGRLGIVVDDDVVRILDGAQHRQDRGVPWGEAVSGSLAEEDCHT